MVQLQESSDWKIGEKGTSRAAPTNPNDPATPNGCRSQVGKTHQALTPKPLNQKTLNPKLACRPRLHGLCGSDADLPPVSQGDYGDQSAKDLLRAGAESYDAPSQRCAVSAAPEPVGEGFQQVMVPSKRSKRHFKFRIFVVNFFFSVIFLIASCMHGDPP